MLADKIGNTLIMGDAIVDVDAVEGTGKGKGAGRRKMAEDRSRL